MTEQDKRLIQVSSSDMLVAEVRRAGLDEMADAALTELAKRYRDLSAAVMRDYAIQAAPKHGG